MIEYLQYCMMRCFSLIGFNHVETGHFMGLDPKVVLYNLNLEPPGERNRELREASREKKAEMHHRQLKLKGIIRELSENGSKKFNSVAKIAREYNSRYGKLLGDISKSTVQRDLDEIDCKSLGRLKRVRQYEADPQKRVYFCQRFLKFLTVQHLHQTSRMVKGELVDYLFVLTNLNLVLWSDECWLDTNDCGNAREFCLPDETPSRRTRIQKGPGIHVFGVVGFNFKFLVILPGPKSAKTSL